MEQASFAGGLTKKPLSEQVYEILERRIITGSLLPGTPLVEETIAEEFGISRSPVREAIIELERIGLAGRSGPRDRRVMVPSESFVADLYSTWSILQSGRIYASSLAAKEEDHRRIRQILREMERAKKGKDVEGYVQLTAELHMLLERRCDNQQLLSLLQSLEKYRKWLTAIYYSDVDTSEISVSEYKQVAKHYINKDLLGLTQSVEGYTRREREKVMKRLQQEAVASSDEAHPALPEWLRR